MKSILECRDLTYRYSHSEKEALSGVNLAMGKGEKIAVIGRNGMGKSTLFLNLNGVYEATVGELFLDGEKISHKKKDLRKLRQKVGLVFQNPDEQFIAPTVEGEISFGLFNLGLKETEIREKVEEAANYLEIGHLLKKSTSALSGGEKKLVSIASVLVMDPEIILFDEPTAGVDLYNLLIFKRALEKLEERDITMVIAIHDNDFVWEWADRVVLIHEGKILFDGTPEEIFRRDDILDIPKLSKPNLVLCQEILREKKIYEGPLVKTWDELKEVL